ETTGLNSRNDRVRLLSLSIDTVGDSRFIYVVDVFQVSPSPLWEVLVEKELVIHNAAFDLAFLSTLGFTPGTVHDTMLLSQLVYAGEHRQPRLGECAERELGKTVDKTQQLSNWSERLTDEQIGYAAKDVEILIPLYEALGGKIRAAKIDKAAAIEQRC